ncbi:MAG: tetratricopeptide repeat protein [Verrucomicrobia bacterium]|nr:tetratricopeptide repeat protein [Verrucomicrobiota bacterium]
MKVRHANFLLAFILAIELGSEAQANDAVRKPGTLTFNKDVAPIVFRHCASCHHPGQAAPFNLLTYADVKKRSKQVAEVVEKRYMPPWLPERGLVELAHDRSLSLDQIGVIWQWVAEGAVEGAGADLPTVPKWIDGWQLGTPDLVVKLPQPYTLAAEGKDVYRNVVIPIPISERKYVKGVEFLPGNWKVVHHAFVTVDSTRLSRIRAAKENPPGFDGMQLPETARMPDGQFLGWQPGKVPQMAPEGLAWTLETNTDVVLQLHLHPSGKPEVVQPTIAFYFTRQPPTNSAIRLNLNALRIDIPAGAKDYAVEDKYTLPVDVNLIGIGPHAHYLGKRVEGYAQLPEGTRKDLILIKDWDFNWQGHYLFAKAVFLPKGTTLVMRWTYDNSAENEHNPNHPPKRVKYGPQTTDEMGELWFQVLPRNASDRNLFERDFYGHLGRLTIDYNESLLKENPNNAEAHTKVGRARFYFGQVAEALNHLQSAIKADPNYDKAYYELGSIYLRQNRLAEARLAFENVIRLNADDYEAEGSLGYIYLRNGDLGQAESHIRAALLINPDDKIARKNLDRVLQAKSSLKQSN